MRRCYWVSYRYFLGDTERFDHWSVERDAPVCTVDDVADMAEELTDRIGNLRRNPVRDLSILFWRPFEAPE